MKKACIALASVLALGVVTACGGDSSDTSGPSEEERVAKNIGTHFATQSEGAMKQQDAQCFADEFVDQAGVPALEKAGLIDSQGEVRDQASPEFDEELAAKYADSYLGCVDFAAVAAASFAKRDKQLDRALLTACLEKALPDELMKKVIVATQSGKAAGNADVSKANTELSACQKAAAKGKKKTAR